MAIGAFKTHPISGARYTSLNFDANSIAGILSLVGIQVTYSTVESWNRDQQTAAYDWGWRSYLKAGDNNVRVPAKPAFLPEEKPE